MVSVGFIVEGQTEKILVESERFNGWANQNNIKICDLVIDASGGGNLLPENIQPLVYQLTSMENPDHIVVLTDLERDESVEIVRERVSYEHVNVIFVAVKAIEAWFLADGEALEKWLGIGVTELYPENTELMPWDRLKEVSQSCGARGPGKSKPLFAKKMIGNFDFCINRAANHPNCLSAREFRDGLLSLVN